jgi:hypothetical protein
MASTDSSQGGAEAILDDGTGMSAVNVSTQHPQAQTIWDLQSSSSSSTAITTVEAIAYNDPRFTFAENRWLLAIIIAKAIAAFRDDERILKDICRRKDEEMQPTIGREAYPWMNPLPSEKSQWQWTSLAVDCFYYGVELTAEDVYKHVQFVFQGIEDQSRPEMFTIRGSPGKRKETMTSSMTFRAIGKSLAIESDPYTMFPMTFTDSDFMVITNLLNECAAFKMRVEPVSVWEVTIAVPRLFHGMGLEYGNLLVEKAMGFSEESTSLEL